MNSNDSARSLTFRIVGGGIMGLCTAICLAQTCRMLGYNAQIFLYEGEAVGGGLDPKTSSPRSQCWLHRFGVLYCATQPHVAVALQQSTSKLMAMAPMAFSSPLAYAIEPPGYASSLGEALAALDIWNRPVSTELMRFSFPNLSLPEGCRIYRTSDGLIHLRLLALALKHQAEDLGVRFIYRRVTSLKQRGDTITGLTLDSGDEVIAQDSDQILLTCGPRIRALLSAAGLTPCGIRLFQSHLIASYAAYVPALLAYVGGGPNMVPHTDHAGQPLSVFGDNHREEIFDDAQPVVPDRKKVAGVRQNIAERFGICIPTEDMLTWAGVKAEIVPPEGSRSQAHHARLVAGTSNCWFALPGKLSQSWACAEDLVRSVLGNITPEAVARPIYETMRSDNSKNGDLSPEKLPLAHF